MGFLLGISPLEWCAILAASALVWITELLNTALERLANALTQERNEHIRHAKDVAAAAVLAAALAAGLIGTIVFLPKLLP